MEECAVLAADEEQPDTIRVALSENPGLIYYPDGRNDCTRLIAAHLYETLINIDCTGEVHPGLASEWYPGEGGRKWTFRLRRGARFQGGDPVTAQDVVDWWQLETIEPHIWAAGVDSVTAAGERDIHVYFNTGHDKVPLELSSLLFSVAKMEPQLRWPPGSTTYMHVPRRGSTKIIAPLIDLSPISGAEGPVLRFKIPSSGFDGRDALEGETDILITEDPDVIEYASARPHLETVPLPAHRTYIILSPTRVQGIRMGDVLPGLDRVFSEGLARDAIPVVAGVHEAPGWWKRAGECAEPADFQESSPMDIYRSDQIVFDRDDPVARSIAERIFSLGNSDCSNSPEAAALAAAIPHLPCHPGGLNLAARMKADLERTLEKGNEFIYIVGLPIHPPDPCYGMRDLVKKVPWLSGLGGRFGDALLPLVDTKRYAIVRKGTAGLSIDWAGNVRINGVLDRPATPPGR